MRCKQGDLAIFTTAGNRNLGKVFRCLRLTDCLGMRTADGVHFYGAVWEVEGEYVAMSGEVHNFVMDNDLRPIRDPGEDAQDETLNWLPVSQKEAA